jgi:hypothetical protein
MLDDIYKALQGIIFNNFPKNSKSEPVVFDLPIKGWYFGERAILSETPGILIQGQSSPPKDVAFGTKEITHQLAISCWIRADNNTLAEKQTMEFTRLVFECLLPHRRIWLMVKCPICLKWSLSPQHYILDHKDIFGDFTDAINQNGSYVAKVKYNSQQIWNQTHTGDVPTLSNSKLAIGAFYLLYDDVENNSTLPGALTSKAKKTIQSYQSNKIKPIRLIYECVFTEIKPVEQNNDKAFFRGGEFTFSAKELVIVPAFGPDNVPTDAWS